MPEGESVARGTTADGPGGPVRPVVPMVELAGVEFTYARGGFRLTVGELEVTRGQTVALIGPSGSGKTTLLHIVAGIATPRTGRVLTGGALMSELDDGSRRDFRIRNIGLVFQEFELLEHLSVLDNILLPYRINSKLRLDTMVRERAAWLADRVGVADKLGRHAGLLSQGEKQRIAVCRALLGRPGLVLADEPTGNLDPDNKDRVLDILFDYACSSGATLITVTHDHDMLARFERVVDLKQFRTQGPRR